MPPKPPSKSGSPITSPSTESLSFWPSSPSSTSVNYHYDKATVPSPAQSKRGQELVGSRRPHTSPGTMHAVATLGRAHKSNFSVASLLGAQPDSRFGTKARQPDPKSPASATSEKKRGHQLARSQGSHLTFPLTGGSGPGAVQTLKALEPPDRARELRNPPSTLSLKLRMPKFRSLGKSRSRSDEGQHLRRSTSPLPQSQSTMRSPAFGIRPPLSNDTFALDVRIPSPSNAYLIPSPVPNSEEGSRSSWNTPPLLSRSSISQEECMPQTPRSTRRTGIFRPESPSLSGVSPSHRDEGSLKYNTALCDNLSSSAEFLKIRSIPTITQDDMSLDSQILAEKRKSLNRTSRRASLSATNMLSAPSSAPSQRPGSSSRSDGSDNHQTTSANPGNQSEAQGTSLITVTFDPTPSLQTDPTRTPPAKLALPQTPSSSNPQNEEDTTPTPTAPSPPEMPFGSLMENDPAHRSSQSSGSQTRSASHAYTSESNPQRVTTPDTSSRSEGVRHRTKATAAQLAKWEQDRELVANEIVEAHPGDAYIIRYEPKQGWMGFWNRMDIEDVIHELRELRLSKA